MELINPVAMDDLGWLYETGNGVNADQAKALSLFNEAASRGSAEGMYHLGVVYHEGLGVQKDLPTACQWFIRAAAEDVPHAATKPVFATSTELAWRRTTKRHSTRSLKRARPA